LPAQAVPPQFFRLNKGKKAPSRAGYLLQVKYGFYEPYILLLQCNVIKPGKINFFTETVPETMKAVIGIAARRRSLIFKGIFFIITLPENRVHFSEPIIRKQENNFPVSHKSNYTSIFSFFTRNKNYFSFLKHMNQSRQYLPSSLPSTLSFATPQEPGGGIITSSPGCQFAGVAIPSLSDFLKRKYEAFDLIHVPSI
jgi:hypothetical protein